MEKRQFDQIVSISTNLLIEIIGFFTKIYNFISSLTSHPLFSVLIALYSLIVLYFPPIFLHFIFSPVLISTGILLSLLLRLGTNQKIQNKKYFVSPELKQTEIDDSCCDQKPIFTESFVDQWNLKEPLGVIYEEHYEGQEEEEEDLNGIRINELGSLAKNCSESDTESSSDGDFELSERWDSPQNMRFRLEEEDRYGLIEIELDGFKKSSNSDHHFDDQDDENLIEIKI